MRNPDFQRDDPNCRRVYEYGKDLPDRTQICTQEKASCFGYIPTDQIFFKIGEKDGNPDGSTRVSPFFLILEMGV